MRCKQLRELLREQPGPGIVYAQTRKKVEELAEKLAEATGRPVLPYHAGLPPEQRAANQAAFVASEDMVMVATVAFGMGIDKPDVRFVAHAGMPKSIEAYYQETGRAGRDGDDSIAVMLWAAADFALARKRLEEVEEGRRAGERTRLEALTALVETHECRRARLLRHFGEDPPAACGNCDNCLDAPGVADATTTAQKLLSAVYRTGQSFGFGYIENVLTGKADERIIQRGHDQLSVFGIVDSEEAPLLRQLSRALQARGSLTTDRARRADAGGRCAGDPQGRCLGAAGARAQERAQERGASGRAGSIRSAMRCSKHCAPCAASWPPRPACRPMSFSTTRCCATWRRAARPIQASSARSTASARASSRPMADAFLAVIRQH